MSAARLVLGTTNRKKRLELQELLRLPNLELVTLNEFPNLLEVVEDGDSFEANARKKASEQAKFLGEWVLGEDSGLAVDALQGAPGIYSARYAGEPCDDDRNNQKLLDALSSVPEGQRTAHYVCAMAVADPKGEICAESRGTCNGRIAFQTKGTGGFGYDPLFLFAEGTETFGQLPAEFKRLHSHRAAACTLIRPLLIELFGLE